MWAIFEVANLGSFGSFFQALEEDARIRITSDLKMHSTSHNNGGRVLGDMIYLIKELRNAVAHNSPVFDCRFKKTNPTSGLISYLQHETGIKNIDFNSIIDYFIMIVFILKKLGVHKKDLRKLLLTLYDSSETLRENIPLPVHTSIVRSDFKKKLNQLREYI